MEKEITETSARVTLRDENLDDKGTGRGASMVNTFCTKHRGLSLEQDGGDRCDTNPQWKSFDRISALHDQIMETGRMASIILALSFSHFSRQMSKQDEFNPYDDNGGTAVAVAGEDFVVIAADTRLNRDYSILSRELSRITLFPNVALATCGMQADCDYVTKNIGVLHRQYQQETSDEAHPDVMSVSVFSTALSRMLYMRRFFSYYALCLVAGIDDNGKGVVYSYDSVGSTECVQWGATGASTSLIMPVLDSQLKNRVGYARKGNAAIGIPPDPTDPKAMPLTVEEAVGLVKEAFAGAVDRNIHTGDYMDLVVLRANTEPEVHRYPMRQD